MAGMLRGGRSLNGVAVAGEQSAAAPRGPAGSVHFSQRTYLDTVLAM